MHRAINGQEATEGWQNYTVISLYYIKDQQDETLAVSFISHCKITALAQWLPT